MGEDSILEVAELGLYASLQPILAGLSSYQRKTARKRCVAESARLFGTLEKRFLATPPLLKYRLGCNADAQHWPAILRPDKVEVTTWALCMDGLEV
jgi:hypothetical protein